MSGRFLLDTNIVIALFAGDPEVLRHLDDADEIYVPAIVLGELHYGARKSARAAENVAKIDQFAEAAALIGCDAETARQYGVIKNGLRERGRPIPENDIWIAAVAAQHELDVVSRDPHFQEIPGLGLKVW
jgi:tRNA(fMet)-specific endonuclease VapC